MALNTAIKNTQSSQAHLDALKPGSPNDRAIGAQLGAAGAGQNAAQARLNQLQSDQASIETSTYAALAQQAEAAVLAAKTNLAEIELRAPFTSTIAKLDLKVGERVAPGATVVQLADFSSWRVRTHDLSERQVTTVQIGQKVALTIDAIPGKALQGEVESVEAVSQLKNGDVTYPVEIKVLDTEPGLKWGMTANVTFAP